MGAHEVQHRLHRVGWLRAAVLGANDGLVSTASLVLGVAAAEVARGDVITAGVAGLVAGALSMAAGEYVSVSAQSDAERADVAMEAQQIARHEVAERAELAAIYVERGLTPALAEQVAAQLMAHDALGAHARDELGLSEVAQARPVRGAAASGAAFAVGASMPLGALALSPDGAVAVTVGVASLACLAALGAAGARAGGAPIGRAVLRVVGWGGLAMAATAGVGAALGVAL